MFRPFPRTTNRARTRARILRFRSKTDPARSRTPSRAGRRDMLGVGIGLSNIFALNVQAFETSVERGIEHIRNPKPGFGVQLHAPFPFESRSYLRVRYVAIAGKFVRERADVT